MKKMLLAYLLRIWGEVVLCFNDYDEMKKQQVMEIGKAGELDNSDKVITIAERL